MRPLISDACLSTLFCSHLNYTPLQPHCQSQTKASSLSNKQNTSTKDQVKSKGLTWNPQNMNCFIEAEWAIILLVQAGEYTFFCHPPLVQRHRSSWETCASAVTGKEERKYIRTNIEEKDFINKTDLRHETRCQKLQASFFVFLQSKGPSGLIPKAASLLMSVDAEGGIVMPHKECKSV